MKREPKLTNRRKYNGRKEAKKRPLMIQDGEIITPHFLNDDWFLNLCERIFNEIKRLKVCTVRQLVENKFKDTDRYHLITAIDALGKRIITRGLILVTYSVNPEYTETTVKGAGSWRNGYKGMDLSKKLPKPDYIYD